MSRLLPLFPLQLVVFPGSAVPLHIFEDRYKEMVGEAEAAGTEFGIVLAKDGGVVNAGCTVIVESVLQRYEDGRFDVMARGQRRFSLMSLDQEKAYLRGEVEFFEDDDWTPLTAELRGKAMRAYEGIQESLRAAGEESKEAIPDPQHPLFGFQLAQSVEDLEFQNVILRSRSEAARVQQFIEFAQEYIPRRQYAAKMKRVAPMNGLGHKPASV